VRKPNQSFWLSPSSQVEEGLVWLAWLVRLRWVAVVAQIITLSFSMVIIHRPSDVVPALAGVIACLVAANLYSQGVLRARESVSELQLVTQLTIDVIALTTFFMLAGGAGNVFTPLYLIHVAMGAIMLSWRRAAMLTVLVIVCYCSLFLFHFPLHWDQHTLGHDRLLAVGQVISFAVTSTSVAGFVVGLSNSLRHRKRQLLDARDRTARTDRLRSVGTLAAGAAHELNTPLSTIGLRLRRVTRRHEDEDTIRDLTAIRTQLDRCSGIVQQLLIGAGDPAASDIERRPLSELASEAVKMWSKSTNLEVRVSDSSKGAIVEVPKIAFVQALINLLENARQAQEEVDTFIPLRMRISRQVDTVVLELKDHGCGLPEEAEQVGEPFFTTKVSGTGLGVFVARALADGAGGGLSYVPAEVGTVARWWFPIVSGRSQT